MRLVIAACVLLFAAAHLPAQSPAVAVNPEVVLETGAHTAGVTDFAFTPDGTQLISISKDKTIRIWDLETTECLKVLRPPTGTGNDGELETMALSGNGKILAVSGTGYAEGEKRRVPIYIIDLTTDRIVKTLEGHTATVKLLSISDDGSRLVSSDMNRTIGAWDVPAGKLICEIKPERKMSPDLYPVALAPDGRHFAWIGYKSVLSCYSVETGKELAKTDLKAPTKYVHLTWHPDSKRFVAQALSHKTVHYLNLKCEVEKELIIDVKPTGVHIRPHFSRDGSRLFLSWGLYVNTIHDTATGKVTKTLPGYARIVDLSPDGKRLAANRGEHETKIAIWNQSAEAWDGSLNTDHRGGGPDRVRWNPNNKEVRWGYPGRTGSNSVGMNLADLQPIASTSTSIETYAGTVTERDGVSLEKGASNYSWLLKDVTKKEQLARWDNAASTSSDKPFGITLLPNRRVAFGTKTGHLQIFNDEGKLLHKWHAHAGSYIWLAPSPDGRSLATTSSDNLMKLWDLSRDRSQPLLNVYMQTTQKQKQNGYVHSFEWIAWTPEGYYACSTDGEKLIAWLTPGGADQLGTTVSPDRFRKQFHRPDVIRRLLELGSLEKAIAAADKERGIETPKVAFADAAPPQVVLTAPVQTAAAKVTVKAKATPLGKYPIQELQLLIDGRPIPTALWKAPDKKLTAVETQWDVELTPGLHRLSVVARTEVSNGLSSFHDITYTDPRAALPSLHVLSVGINSYPGDWKLNCAANDATGIARVFQQQSKGCYREVNVTTLLDAKATRQAILDGLVTIKRTMKPQDVAVIFFAGHGVKHKKGPFHLLTADTDFGVEEKSGLSNDDLKKRLAEIPGRILVMLDACHSGASRLDELARELSDEDCGVVVMCAAMGREQAGEERKLGHGYFALAVLEGLGGKADASKKDGQIYLHHLEHYVIDRVVELSNDEQHPVSGKPTSVRSFALAKP